MLEHDREVESTETFLDILCEVSLVGESVDEYHDRVVTVCRGRSLDNGVHADRFPRSFGDRERLEWPVEFVSRRFVARAGVAAGDEGIDKSRGSEGSHIVARRDRSSLPVQDVLPLGVVNLSRMWILSSWFSGDVK